MLLDGQRVDLEVQVENEGDYPERTLYHWAREYSSALLAGEKYSKLPRTIIISIVGFNMFPCAEFHSEFQALETTRHIPLTDKLCLHFFELHKLPAHINADDILLLWLSLFRAETEEEMEKIEALENPVINQAVDAYKRIVTSGELREMERLYEKARHDEAQALHHARLEGEAKGRAKGEKAERKKWQGVVADKDALIAELRARLGDAER